MTSWKGSSHAGDLSGAGLFRQVFLRGNFQDKNSHLEIEVSFVVPQPNYNIVSHVNLLNLLYLLQRLEASGHGTVKLGRHFLCHTPNPDVTCSFDIETFLLAASSPLLTILRRAVGVVLGDGSTRKRQLPTRASIDTKPLALPPRLLPRPLPLPLWPYRIGRQAGGDIREEARCLEKSNILISRCLARRISLPVSKTPLLSEPVLWFACFAAYPFRSADFSVFQRS